MVHKLKLFAIVFLALALTPFPEKLLSAQEGGGTPPMSLPKISLSCVTVPLIASTMASKHMSFSEINDDVHKRVIALELKSMDPTKVLLTQKEFKNVEKKIAEMVEGVKKRDCSLLFALQKQQIEWQKNLENDVRDILNSKSFKVSRKTKIELDADKRPRPKNKKQQRALRNKILQLQMANLIAGGISEKEAKEKLIHRYELATKRVSEVSTEELLGFLLNAYALSLDPHSLYFSPDDLEDFKIQMGLSLTGIGATLQSRDGFTVVKELTPGGPADLQGELKTGDKIVAVAQGKKGEPVDVIDMNLKDVVKKIRGDKGTWVVLTVLRPGKEVKRLQVAIKRDKIDLADQAAKITYHEVLRGGKKLKIGLLDLPSFYAGAPPEGRDSAKDVQALLAEANKHDVDALVVDLSRNGGGSLQSAIEIVGEFVRTGAVVGVGDGTTQPQVMNDLNASIGWTKPVAVLTSNLSASASEIFAGALKDYKRAIILGDKRTFGKGTVQQLMPLPSDLGVIKVTTSKFFLPGGQSTQRLGVASDVIIPSAFSFLDIGEDQEEFSLSAGHVPPFLSDRATVGGEWLPVDYSKMGILAKKSSKRQSAEQSFIDLAKKTKEQKTSSTITIAEILDDPTLKEEEEKENDSVKKSELTPQATEAIEVLADYLEATGFKLDNLPKKEVVVRREAQKKTSGKGEALK